MRGELPPQWVPAFDIIMPLKPTVRTVGGDWLSWNLERVDAMRAFEHEHKDILHWSIGDSEVCARAGRCACALDDMLNGHPLPMSRQDKLDTVLDYCERLDVDRPNAKTPEGVIARAVAVSVFVRQIGSRTRSTSSCPISATSMWPSTGSA